ncbi:MAG: bifunctional oligoribonuclease/PAP phosphatase NrnA [Spirochaetia bacterium]
MNAFQGAIDFLTRTRRFIITSHETPDADAIGSECAISRALRAMGKEAIILNADPIPRKLAFLDPDNLIQVLEREDQLPADMGEYSLLMLDTNDAQNIGQIASLVLPRVREHFIIDHHEQEEDLLAGNFIQKSASSTAEILYQLLREMNVTIDLAMAQALFTGIVYDTGSFVYPKTTALTFEIARDLVAKGVRPNIVYSKLYESNSISALILQTRVLATLELFFANHVSLLTMTRDMVVNSGANYEEADQLINIPLRSEDIRVSVFFKQNPAGLLRCSLRSKANINVAEIAQSFGGGGHRTAAGFKCRDTLEKTKQIVLEKLRKHFP